MQTPCTLHLDHSLTNNIPWCKQDLFHIMQSLFDINEYKSDYAYSFLIVSQNIVAVEVRDMATFFWEHLMLDMKVLGRALSSAEDEVALYLHQVLARITARPDVTGVCYYSS